jgi:hypothetical protein
VDDSEVAGLWERNGRGQFKAISWILPEGTQVNVQYHYPAPFTSHVWFVDQFHIFNDDLFRAQVIKTEFR